MRGGCGLVGRGGTARPLAAADVGIYLMEDTLLNRAKCPVKLADMIAGGCLWWVRRWDRCPSTWSQGHTGLLRRSGDDDGIIADLVELLQNRGERERLGKTAGTHYAAYFSWDKAAERAEQAYGRLVGGLVG